MHNCKPTWPVAAGSRHHDHNKAATWEKGPSSKFVCRNDVRRAMDRQGGRSLGPFHFEVARGRKIPRSLSRAAQKFYRSGQLDEAIAALRSGGSSGSRQA